MKVREVNIFWRGGLTNEEYSEMVGIEYTLTHYGKHYLYLEERYRQLQDKCYSHPQHHFNIKK